MATKTPTKVARAPRATPKTQPMQLAASGRTLKQSTYVAQRPTRMIIDWTPRLIKAAKIQAESGSFELLGSLYDNLLGEDDRHHGTLASVAHKVLGLPLSFDADGDKRRQSKNEDLASKDFKEMSPLVQSVDLISRGLSVGFSAAQLLPWDFGKRPANQSRLLPMLQPIPTQCMRYDWPTRTWFILTEDQGEVELTTGDGRFLLFLPYGSDRPWMKGTWRACAWWCLLKQFSIKDWGRHSENARGILSVETPQGAKDGDRKVAAKELEQAGADGVFVPPPQWTLELVQADANTYETFEAQINTCNSGIAVANKGESFTSGEGASGLGDGAGQTRKEVSDEKATFVARALEDCYGNQLMTPYSALNFGKSAPVPWPHWQTEQDEDLKAKYEGWSAGAKAIKDLQDAGVNVDTDAVAEEMGVKVKPGPYVPPTPPQLPAVPENGAEPKLTQPAQEEDPEQDPELLSVMSGQGVMIALYPSPEVQAMLAQPGGEPAEEIHLTLLYLGRALDYPYEYQQRLAALLKEWAPEQVALSGVVQGAGVFDKDEGSVLWAAADMQGLSSMQGRLHQAVQEAGLLGKQEHGFQPHMTLAYSKERISTLPELPKTPLYFDRVCLVVGPLKAWYYFRTVS